MYALVLAAGHDQVVQAIDLYLDVQRLLVCLERLWKLCLLGQVPSSSPQAPACTAPAPPCACLACNTHWQCSRESRLCPGGHDHGEPGGCAGTLCGMPAPLAVTRLDSQEAPHHSAALCSLHCPVPLAAPLPSSGATPARHSVEFLHTPRSRPDHGHDHLFVRFMCCLSLLRINESTWSTISKRSERVVCSSFSSSSASIT